MHLKVAKLSYIIRGDFFNCQISCSIGMLHYTVFMEQFHCTFLIFIRQDVPVYQLYHQLYNSNSSAVQK